MTADQLVIQQLGAQSLEIIRLQVRVAETYAKLAAAEATLAALTPKPPGPKPPITLRKKGTGDA